MLLDVDVKESRVETTSKDYVWVVQPTVFRTWGRRSLVFVPVSWLPGLEGSGHRLAAPAEVECFLEARSYLDAK